MNQLYNLLVFVHIFSAILGIGPGFVLTFIPMSAKTMTELKHAYLIRHKLHTFVMIGGTLLLITGLLLGIINTGLFRAGWYVTSLILFLVALAMGPLALSKASKPIKALFEKYEEEQIPNEYVRLSKRLFALEYIENALFLIIICLMILKPF
ncbi:DUF2269 family protein [Aquibacillus salsiterrae]|uniref:DUF2269 domain-containing protein n=1 Tax=Aquibacillus salsiterrae TaxID=2950439 RepID=A0A9X3WHI3_9BACI|nr:DUF2269 family protein [Aquibacillus salsiterrae]MDC3417136.1 DUF2269 domain-containing protein [Aquibacillus salsiterrae]